MIHMQKSPTNSDFKVGILSNEPTKPSRGEDIDYFAEVEIEEQVEAVEEALKKLGFRYKKFLIGENFESLVIALKTYKPDVVVNLCEGAFGDSHLEMDVPSILELLRIPYTGSSPLSLGLCQDKALAKDILKANKISTPNYRVLSRYNDWDCGIRYPLFVKPLREDASLGISKENYIRNAMELKRRSEYIIERYRQPVLVEEYIGGRELNISVIGNLKPEVLPISEIVFKFQNEPKIVDYSAKWISDSEEFKRTVPVCPANLEMYIKNKVESAALSAYASLQCRDYARIDIRLRGRIPYVLEVNPNPDIAPSAGFVRSLKAAEISYEEFIKKIIYFALERKH